MQKKIPTQEKHKKQLNCSSLPLSPAHKYHSSLYPFYHDSSGVIRLELSVLRLLRLVYPCPTAHPHQLPLSGQPLPTNVYRREVCDPQPGLERVLFGEIGSLAAFGFDLCHILTSSSTPTQARDQSWPYVSANPHSDAEGRRHSHPSRLPTANSEGRALRQGMGGTMKKNRDE